ncbi:sperm flagellar protein 1 [Drosophila pseudoobscura]|uniref:Sperm flagellar protein 1 n=1 Tax=Drosophila pseudoobscura pseudoobscura TaxID=46245 RepID=A0A6I8UZG7_DROPS|nr:sperm flagellar protein 1 [Drosophila pseudoobscura]
MHTINNKNLSIEELAEVHDWLLQNNMGTHRLRRDFSDVLPLAEILKRSYPRLVDVYNYPKKCSVQLKMANWETFNFKVLSKLNIKLSREFIELLSNNAHGAAEVLLHEIIRLEKRQRMQEERSISMRQEQAWAENDEVKIVVISKQVGDAIVQVPQKMILYSLYEKMAQENMAKDVMLDSYQQRLTHMENIIKIKTERIDELLMQMGKLPPKMAPAVTSSYFLTDDGKYQSLAPAPSLASDRK